MSLVEGSVNTVVLQSEAPRSTSFDPFIQHRHDLLYFPVLIHATPAHPTDRGRKVGHFRLDYPFLRRLDVQSHIKLV
jgi:hypothetical protein